MTTPDPAGIATNLTDGVGNAVVDLAVDLAPVAVPFVLAMAAIGGVLRKFGLTPSAGLDAFERKVGLGTYTSTRGRGPCLCDDCDGTVTPKWHHGGCYCRECELDHDVRASEAY
jgi:hypothetical protein